MLRLILGRSGFGKSTYIIHELQKQIQPSILLVPEQMSFQTERALLEKLGANRAAECQVYSFTRMAEKILNTSAAVLSDGAKTMLMERAFTQVQDSLSVLSGRGKPDMIRSLLHFCDFCKQSAVLPQQLKKTISDFPDNALHHKMKDITLLLETFNALVSRTGKDEQDLIAACADRLQENLFFSGKIIYVDGFSGFTASERRVLEAAMVQAASVTVTLCTDRLQDTSGGIDRFSVSMNTARDLMESANRHRCQIANPVWLTTPYRFQNEQLRVLEATAFTSEILEMAEQEDHIRVTVCSDIYEECTAVVRDIRRLMRLNNLRAKHIAITARDLHTYIGVLDAALERAGIPYFLDRRTPVLPEPLFIAVFTALRIACGEWRTEWLIRLIKTGLLGFSTASTARLENYIFTWHITGMQFQWEWQSHPRGFAGAFEEKDRRELNHLNRLRRRLVDPLMQLGLALQGARTGEQMAEAILDYLHCAHIDRMIERQIISLETAGEFSLASHTKQVWEALMGLMDDLTICFRDSAINSKQGTEWLRAAAGVTDVGSIPQQIDAIQIGQADRIRYNEPKAVFILGANEGIFPALPSEDPILSDRDRKILKKAGLPFEDMRMQQTASEQFLGYVSLTAASEKMFITTLQTLPDGSRGEPSAICRTVFSHFPSLSPCRARVNVNDIETLEDAFERMAGGFYSNTPLSHTLYGILKQDKQLAPRIHTMTRMIQSEPIAFADAGISRRLFGNHMTLSATKIDRFYRCKFAYFCQYGMHASPRRAADLGVLEYGTLVHYVMENTLPVYVRDGVQTIQRERCLADAKAVINRYIDEEMGGFSDKSGRFLYLLGRLYTVCGKLLWHSVQELCQSAFTPVDYELPIGSEKEGIEPIRFALPDGGTVRMIGRIDRVDVYSDGGKSYVRVIDYKTGQKKLLLSDVVEGLNIQLLVYMLTVWKNGTVKYGDVIPAGVLYMPTQSQLRKADTTKGTDLDHKQKKSEFPMRMNGLLIDNEKVLRAMEPGLSGIFIPAKKNKDGTWDAGSCVVSLAEFGALGRQTLSLLTDMADVLHNGDIDALPLMTSSIDSCKQCDFHAICGHEDQDRVRTARFHSDADVLRSLQPNREGNASCRNG